MVIHTGRIRRTDKLKNTIDVTLRNVMIMTDEILLNDVKKCKRINRRLSFNERKIPVDVIGPSEDLGDSLDFDKKLREWRIELGYTDARKWWSRKDGA